MPILDFSMPDKRLISTALLIVVGAISPALGSMDSPRPSDLSASSKIMAPNFVEGREDDANVAQIALRLATAGRARCATLEPNSGLVLQHLSQFELADRAGVLATLPLDRGPGVIAVVAGGPAAKADVRPGDVLLGIDGQALPPEAGLSIPFEATRARARADAVLDRLTSAQSLTVLRNGQPKVLQITPVPACASRVHLARSNQRNAFADGQHVFLTTGAIKLLHDDDELAFLLAHEMAHNILGHAAQMRSGSVAGRKELRRLESDADRLAGDLMIDAGFDPVKGAVALKRLGGMDLGLVLFAKHDSPATRIAAMRALAAQRRAP